MQNSIFRTVAVVFSAIVLLGASQPAHAGWEMPWKKQAQPTDAQPETGANRGLPSLIVSDGPVAPEVIYSPGTRDAFPGSGAAAQPNYAPSTTYAPIPKADDNRWGSGHVETLVTRKVVELGEELGSQQQAISSFQERLAGLQAKSDTQASDYYALIAFINTQLQSGTTAGNPILTERWHQAQTMLDGLSKSTGSLNDLVGDVSNEASKAAYLQESVRATYGLSGAVANDHKSLQVLEDGVNQSIIELSRLLTSVNDEINRRTAYLRAEQLNMQTLSLAVSNGELYGQNMANSLFKKVAESGQEVFAAGSTPARRRPLVVIRFDRPSVDYQQAVYTTVSQALEKYPAARFDLVAVSPTEGNPAQVALASNEARKNGEGVLRSLTQMGLPMERIRLNAAGSRDVRSSEVHLYIQ